MHLFASDRPTLGGTPAALVGQRAMPHFIMVPISADTTRILCMLPTYDNSGSYSYRQIEILSGDVSDFLLAYTHAPEETLTDFFGFVAKATAVKATRNIPITNAPLPMHMPSVDDLL